MSGSALGSSPRLTVRIPVLLVFLLLILAAPALADSHARIVRLSYVDGDVELDKGDGRSFNTAYINMPISHGWRLWARDGQAEAEFEDGSSIRLTPDTLVVFSDLSLDSNGGRNTTIELEQGTAYFDIRHRDQDSFHLIAGRDRIELSKAVHFRVSTDKHQVELAVLSGEVQVSNGSASEVAVRKGETIRLDDDDPTRYYLAKSVDEENYDQWDNQRVKNHDEVVSTAAVNGTNNLVYGLSDLNSYGDYFFVPGYGNMWRPAYAPLGWDPFADGYWLSYPGSGYLFVSSYPWGWAPYRYGSWRFVNGRGWCWAPGNHWNSWHTVPPVHNRPPNFRRPEVPVHGPSVIAVNGGAPTVVPPRRIVLDNDALEHRWPRSVKEADTNRQILRQGQSQTTVPASGFAPGNSSAPQTIVGRFPGNTVIGGSGRGNQPTAGQQRWDALRNERMERDQRNFDLNRSRQAGSQTAPAVPSGAMRGSFPSTPQNTHASPAPMSPRMESHPSSQAQAMRMESRPMSAPSMGSMHTASPSFSGGSMSHGSGGGGGAGGGGHSGGGGHH